jgi:nucleotide-binding universal stress UspA family protein
VKIVAATVRDMGFLRRRIGQLIVATAIIDDTLGWIVIAVIFGLARDGGARPLPILASIAGTLLFLFVSLTLGQRVVSLVIRWSNDRFVSEFPVITAILTIAGCMALITAAIGVHTVLGAFVAGVLIGRSPILTDHIRERLEGLTIGLFMPVFFGAAGLGADLTVLRDPVLLAVAVGLVAIASLGKFGGAFAGGLLARLPMRETLALASGMNARGSTEVVIATIGLSMGVFSQPLYSMIVAMAIVTTLAMPPMLRWSLRRVPVGAEEEKRLAREELEAKGFIGNLERLLVAADHSPNGHLASRVAGMLSAARDMPLTVLTVSDGAATSMPGRAAHGGALDATAEQPAKAAGKPDITVRHLTGTLDDAVAKAADKGHDLLFIGLNDMIGTEAGASLVAAFEGAVCLVQARGDLGTEGERAAFNILVPVTGTPESQNALEIAVALARVGGTPLTLLSVLPSTRVFQSQALGQLLLGTRGVELRAAVRFADQYGVRTRAVARRDVPVEDAILEQVRREKHNVVLLGVRTRSSDVNVYGAIATDVLDRARCSVMLISG